MVTEADYSEFLIDGKYVVQRMIGEGAMSTVYVGTARATSRPVAIKIMKRNLMEDQEIVTRFLREVRACVNLKHKNIVSVLDGGTLSTGESYMVMEHLEGKSLADLLEAEKVLRPARAIDLICQAADGLELAHRKGYIHRDIKPENVMVVTTAFNRECAKILDFGVAKLSDSLNHDNFATAAGDVLGTPLYMSPEQIRGEKIDGRSDIYSLGCILYQSLCGKTPIQGETAFSVMKNHMDEIPPHLSYYAPYKIPDELNSLVQRAIAKFPEGRYSSMSEFAEELRKYATPPVIARLRSVLNFNRSSSPKQKRKNAGRTENR